MEGIRPDGSSYVAGAEAAAVPELTLEMAKAWLDEVLPPDNPGGTQEYRDAFYAVTRGQGTPEQVHMVGFADRCMGVINGAHDRFPGKVDA